MSFLHTSSTDPDVTLTATMVAQAAHRAKQVSLRQLLLQVVTVGYIKANSG